MLSDKKGGIDFSLENIVKIIMAILVLGLITSFTLRQTQDFLDFSETESCLASLKVQQFVKEISPLGLGSVRNACQTLGPIDLPDQARTKNAFFGEVADLMAKTWHMTGKGEIKAIWDESSLGSAFYGNKCIVMYYINFEEKNGFSQPILSTDLEEFIIEEEMRLNKPNSKTPWKYREYIEESGGFGKVVIMPTEFEGSTQPDDAYIRPGTDYAISVLSPQNSWFGNSVNDATYLLFSSADFADQIGCSIRLR